MIKGEVMAPRVVPKNFAIHSVAAMRWNTLAWVAMGIRLIPVA